MSKHTPGPWEAGGVVIGKSGDGGAWQHIASASNSVDAKTKLANARLIALACSPPPAGHDHWTLRLLASKVVESKLASSMSHEGVRKRLKKTVTVQS